MTGAGGEGTAGPESGDVGSVAEEAAKLIGALQDWATESGADRAGTAARGAAEVLRSVVDDIGHGEDCVYCPLCRLINRARVTSPEVREHLVEALASLAQAATAALQQQRREGPPRRGSGPEHIDLDD